MDCKTNNYDISTNDKINKFKNIYIRHCQSNINKIPCKKCANYITYNNLEKFTKMAKGEKIVIGLGSFGYSPRGDGDDFYSDQVATQDIYITNYARMIEILSFHNKIESEYHEYNFWLPHDYITILEQFPVDANRKYPARYKFKNTRSMINFKKYIEPEAGDVDITKENIIISVGRGIENSDNIGLADDLIELIGGAVAASRPVCDQGWLPLSRQVGKSGMIVKPKLYFALGISGAPEHVEGMKDSDLIIAINKDPDAPIFNVAHYGVCADLQDIVPVLTDLLKEKKN